MEMGCNLLFDVNLSKSTFNLQHFGEIIEELCKSSKNSKLLYRER